MRKSWLLKLLVLLIAALGILPILPAAAQSSCTISTRATVRLRSGHSTTDAVVGTMPRNVQLQAVERFVEDLGRNRTRVWFRLVKEEAAPAATSEQVWVGGTVKMKGDCVNIASAAAPAAPVTDAGAAPAAPAAASGAVLPQSGTWSLTYGDTVFVTCDGVGSADLPASEIFTGGFIFDLEIASSDSGFSVDGNGYVQDGNGTWHGYYSEAQGTGEAYMRVNTPTSILGDIIQSFSDTPGCTFKSPFWASPK